MPAELCRPVAVAKLGRAGLTVEVQASTKECAAVAARMDVPAIRSLQCRFALHTEADGVSVLATGHLRAQVTQVCVASAEDFEVRIDEQFTVRFVPDGAEGDDLDPDSPDEILYAEGTIDLGEATAEQLGLALDPYPRLPGAEGSMIEEAEDASPFAALARHGLSGRTKQ